MAAPVPTVYFSDMPSNWLDTPDDLGQGTLAVAIFLAITSVVTVALRIWSRFTSNAFGVDDYLMVVATGIFVANSIFCCLDIYAGLGSHDYRTDLTEWNTPATVMYLLLWQATYAWDLPFVKCSICLSLFRITTEKKYRIMLWLVMFLATFSAMIGFIAVVITCRPIGKNWDPVLQADPTIGYCLDYGIIQGISYYISASSIITDWACAIIPCFIVWNLQMKRRLKISVAGILALGAVASLTTIIRLPYLGAYTALEDTYYKVCNIVLWSQIECGIGIIAGSLPSLRRLLKGLVGSSKDASYGDSAGPNLNTIGGGNRSGKMSRSVKMSSLSRQGGNTTTCEAIDENGHTWMELDDDSESQKRIITRTHEVSVSVEDNGPLDRSRTIGSERR
ncbi:hypothetical protein F4780DRAFT_24345 [Xylariomycetidae sp. FL0641]|nr:hypothetical protein F4780DRAFT_24345 [Xylariomycetidae sp. FL0641]